MSKQFTKDERKTLLEMIAAYRDILPGMQAFMSVAEPPHGELPLTSPLCKCLVCGMILEKGDAIRTSAGWFCSEGCDETFRNSPLSKFIATDPLVGSVVPEADAELLAAATATCAMPAKHQSSRIKDMLIGNKGWTVPWAISVGEDNLMYLNPDYTLSDRAGGTVSLIVERKLDGFHCTHRNYFGGLYEWNKTPDAKGLPVKSFNGETKTLAGTVRWYEVEVLGRLIRRASVQTKHGIVELSIGEHTESPIASKEVEDFGCTEFRFNHEGHRYRVERPSLMLQDTAVRWAHGFADAIVEGSIEVAEEY